MVSRAQFGPRTAGLVILWVTAIAVLCRFASLPDPYRVHVMGRQPPLPYPWVETLFVSGLMVAQGLILYAILRPESYAASWRRSLLALVLHVPATLFFVIVTVMGHSPPTRVWLVTWLFVCSVVLLLTFVASAVRAASGRPANPDRKHTFSIRHLLIIIAGIAAILAVARLSFSRYQAGVTRIEVGQAGRESLGADVDAERSGRRSRATNREVLSNGEMATSRCQNGGKHRTPGAHRAVVG